MSNTALQLDAAGRLRHFLSTEALPAELLTEILDRAEGFLEVGNRAVKKVPLLRGKTIVNLFFEPSTRTRTTFELAAKRLSADVLNVPVEASATKKGESLLDTLRTLEAMHCDIFVVRHHHSGAPHFIAANVRPGVRVINAGDGRHAHPTQALLDAFTIRQHRGNISGAVIAIVGDIAHSRVARSEIHALLALGAAEVRVIGPATLIPTGVEELGVKVINDMQGLADCDVIIMLRLQKERMEGPFLPGGGEYFRAFGLTPERVAKAKPDALIMHPGPINRGVEIASEVADGNQSLILQQVSYGIAVRMAIMSLIASGIEEEDSAGPR